MTSKRRRAKRPGIEFEEEVVTDPQAVEITSPIKFQRPPLLRQVSGPGAPREFALILDSTVVGRGEDTDIPIKARDVSRRHAVFEKRGEEVRCTDLESRHGMFLNGVQVHSCTLRTGDSLQFGSATFVYEERAG
ncbi:MAG: FHA domain-containing protein [Pseudomonadota bacterium]